MRIQSSEGTKRIDVEPSETILQLFEKVHDKFDLSGYAFALYRERGCKDELISTRSKTVRSSGLHHGDMLYMAPLNGAVLWPQETSPRPSTSSSGTISKTSGDVDANDIQASVQTNSHKPSLGHQEDDVDLQLFKLDGKVQRKRDEKLCRHGSNGCCVHCSPLEPFDEAYLKDQNIKHLSFHAYLRKLFAGVDRGKFVSLEDISCRIKTGCKDHPPWPKGICSKCQPNAITLNRQIYRHVDNVMFENPHLVERFLNYWRSTGHQRIGFLYGNYEIHADVPLGIRATVAAIYEPPQESTRDSVVLLPEEKEELVEELARQLGLRRVGWIFTDLIADDVKKGTVKHVRNIESHFLSSEECIMAGYFQNKHPNPCRFSPVGYFGSKFVTVCVTGDASNQVHMEGYGVTNQCMALVRDNCLVPTKDAPELGYIRESSDKQYVPDVYYKEKDSYGNEVPRLARPLPVEYLLVDIPASTPITPVSTFHADADIQPFPVENRMVDGHIQDFNALSSYIQQFPPDQFLKAASDFHFLLYIATMDMLPMKEYMGPLLEAVKTQNAEQAQDWANSEHWATVEQLIAASSSSPPQSRPQSVAFTEATASGVNLGFGSASGSGLGSGLPVTSGGGSNSLWTCPHCTFLNQADLVNCEMCRLPR